jgi:putative spermidine/putrescine transport system permease protein
MRRWQLSVLLSWPALATLALTVVPVWLLLRISIAPPDPAAPWGAGLTFEAYRSLLAPDSIHALRRSLQLAVVVGIVSVGAGFPLTYFITRMQRRAQVGWLVFLLATLTLSDVLIAFSWQVMLSKRIGLSRIFVALGLMQQPDSLAPSVGAIIACLTYLVIPFTVLTLYPALSQLDRSLIEAARTLGAPAWRAFTSVVLPLTRVPTMVAFVLAAVLTLGSFVPPVALGKPEHWPMSVLIGNAALAGHNLPRAAAMSVLLLVVTALLALGAVRAVRHRPTP